MVNADITRAHPEGQKFCQVIGFEQLYEPRTLEDSQFTVRIEFCKYIKLSYGTVVRDFESEAKTRYNFQFR